MKDRIRQIMESQHMTQQLFATSIGLSPATLSNIYTGRTNPTLTIVEAIKKKIPNINTDWLMFGTGEMYLDSKRDTPLPQSQPSDLSGHNHPHQESMLDFSPTPTTSTQVAPPAQQNFSGVRNTRSEAAKEEVKIIDKPQRRVLEIRIFYDDQTWETFVPSKK